MGILEAMSENQPTPNRPPAAPSQDMPELLNFEGLEDEETFEARPPAQAQRTGPLGAVRLFYRHYWNGRGEASASEFYWALAYLLVGTALVFGVTFWLNYLVASGQASSAGRTLFMLAVVTNPLWIAANLAPLASLVKRRRAGGVS